MARPPSTRAIWLCVASLGAILSALLVAAVFSRGYWGYWLVPPPMPREVRCARAVSGAGVFTIEGEPGGSLLDRLRHLLSSGRGPWLMLDDMEPEADAAYPFLERVAGSFDERGLIGRETRSLTFEETLAICRALLESSAVVTISSESRLNLMSGEIFEVTSDRGDDSVLVSFVQGEIRNDRWMYVEAVLKKDAADGFSLSSVRRLYYDLDFEGLTWVPIFGILAILFIAPVVIVAAVGTPAGRRSARTARCANCGYELDNLPPNRDLAVCPECGHGSADCLREDLAWPPRLESVVRVAIPGLYFAFLAGAGQITGLPWLVGGAVVIAIVTGPIGAIIVAGRLVRRSVPRRQHAVASVRLIGIGLLAHLPIAAFAFGLLR